MFNKQRYITPIYFLNIQKYDQYIDNIILLSSSSSKSSFDELDYQLYDNVIHVGKNVKNYIKESDNQNAHSLLRSETNFSLVITTMKSSKHQANIQLIDWNFNEISFN